MRFFTLLFSVSFLAVGSAFPIWLPLPQHHPTAHLSQTPPPAPAHSGKVAPVGQLIGFVSTPLVAPAASILTETYFYQGQYVRRGQVLAKLKVRGTSSIAYLNAPHDGVLSRAQAAVGELLTPSAPLTTLTDQTRPRLRLPVAYPVLHVGDSIQVRLASNPAVVVRGKILRWYATPATAAPEVTLQLRKSIPGATIGSALTVESAAAAGTHQRTAAAAKPASTAKRKPLYSLAVAQE